MNENEQDYGFMLKVKDAYEKQGSSEGSIRAVATGFGISRTKVRKILVTLGAIKSEITEKASELKAQGLTLEQIADEMGMSMATVSTYLPYNTVMYNGENQSANAGNIKRYRERLKAVSENQVHHTQNITKKWDEKMRERSNKIFKLHLELNTAGADFDALKKYGKVKVGLSRDILVPSDITLHSLHYVIQRLFGWQNSHLHHFELSDELFNKITENNFCKWADYCGTYFRFPSEDWEDIYWDDDYNGDVSVKTWFRRKYTAPYMYGGMSEHFMEARYNALKFINENKSIPVSPSFDEFMKMSAEKKRAQRIKEIEEVTCDEIDRLFGGASTAELLERLKLSELLTDEKSRIPTKAFMKKRLDSCVENVREFVDLHNDMVKDNGYEYWRKMNKWNGTAQPLTDELLYQYDYGDGWEVKITLEDIYYSDSSWDHPDKSGNIVASVTDEQAYDDQTPLYKNGEIIEGVLAEQIKIMITNNRPLCIAADGLPVLDDVGGVFGYCEMLLALHGKENRGAFDNAESAKEWSSGMGWFGRMNKPEKIL